MVKVKIRTGRGTGTIEVDIDDLKFTLTILFNKSSGIYLILCLKIV